MLDRLKEYAGLFRTGMLKQMTPAITGGFINGFFHEWKVDREKITDYVENDRSLWDNLTPDQQQEINTLTQNIDLNFVTPVFLINSIRKDFPAVASLFLSWPEAAEWLDRQIQELKGGVEGTKY
jgi:hypothetical protein